MPKVRHSHDSVEQQRCLLGCVFMNIISVYINFKYNMHKKPSFIDAKINAYF